MSLVIRSTCIVLLLTMAAVTPSAAEKRLAVLDLTASGSDVEAGAGKIAADALEQRLVQDGRYSMIERASVEKIQNEQDLANGGRVDAATAAKIGKILGVDAVIFGSVAQCNVQAEMVDMPTIGQRPQAKAICSIAAKVVDTASAQILAAPSGNGETQRKVFVSNFDSTAVLREAIDQAVDAVCLQMNAAAKLASFRTEAGEASGLVADVSGDTLIVTIGSNAGLQVGQKLEITRKGRQITDPTTNEVIKTITEKIGEATVTDVDAKSATATFAGRGSPKRGDTAKVVP